MLANEYESLALCDFHWLHRHPELSLEEFETTRYIRGALSEIEGVEPLELDLPTGVLARISGDPNGPVIGVRADIDALPICEETGLDYASERPDVMHACGHDFHTAMLLSLARLLATERGNLPGTVVLIFQPAEENARGAKQLLDTGCLEREGVQAVFALHVSALHPTGTVSIGPGPFNAAVDRFSYTVTGIGGHASAPHDGLDPIPAAAHLVGRINEIVSRRIEPAKPALISVCQFHAGSAWNIMPESAELEGTARSFHPEVRERIADCLEREAEALRAEGYRVDFRWMPGCPATNNDPALAELVAKVARERGFDVVPQPARMGGEDFASFQERLPGAMFDLGVSSPHPLHHPGFMADPAALEPATELMAAIVRRALEEGMPR